MLHKIKTLLKFVCVLNAVFISVHSNYPYNLIQKLVLPSSVSELAISNDDLVILIGSLGTDFYYYQMNSNSCFSNLESENLGIKSFGVSISGDG